MTAAARGPIAAFLLRAGLVDGVLAIMLLGHWIEMRALGTTQGALDALAALLPDEAERITDTGTETVPVSELREGDTVLVRSPAAAAILMSASTIVVALNAQLLRRVKLNPSEVR